MSREKRIWTLVTVVAGLFLLGRGLSVGNGRQYVREVTVPAVVEGDAATTKVLRAPASAAGNDGVTFSWSRTIGTWIGALCTLAVFSFLYGDTPLYKLAESIFVGVSAAYYMVQTFWTEIVENLCFKLSPALLRDGRWPEFVPDVVADTYDLRVNPLLPGMKPEAEPNYLYLVPLLLSLMMLWRLSPKGAWIARWPLAFFIGATAGFRLVSMLESDFVTQIQSTILPFVVYASDGTIDPWASLKNVFIVLGVLMGLVYFFFSVEHKGVVGGVARGGVWLLMITFGASFGYTVMGRIALLADRLEFLFNDWLWLIDPAGERVMM